MRTDALASAVRARKSTSNNSGAPSQQNCRSHCSRLHHFHLCTEFVAQKVQGCYRDQESATQSAQRPACLQVVAQDAKRPCPRQLVQVQLDSRNNLCIFLALASTQKISPGIVRCPLRLPAEVFSVDSTNSTDGERAPTSRSNDSAR